MKTAELILRQTTPFRDDQVAAERIFRRWIRDLPLQALRGEHAAPDLNLPPLLDIPLSGGMVQLTGQSLRLMLIAHAEIMKTRRAGEPLDATLSSVLISWKALSGETLHLLSGVLLAALSLGREDDETLPDEAALTSQPSAFTGACLGAALGLAATLRARGEALPTGLIQRLLSTAPQGIPGVAHNLAFAALWSSQVISEYQPLTALLRQAGQDLPLTPLMPGLLSASERELPELNLGRLTDTGDMSHWNGAPMQGVMEQATTWAPRLLARLLRGQGHLSGLGPASVNTIFWQGDELSPSLWMTGDETTLMHRVTSLLQMILSQCRSTREYHRVITQLSALEDTEEAEITPLILAMRGLLAQTIDRRPLHVTTPQARRAGPTLIGWLDRIPALTTHDLSIFVALQTGDWKQIRKAAAQTTPHAVAALALRELLMHNLTLSAPVNETPDEPWRQANNAHIWMWVIQEGPRALSRLRVPHQLPGDNHRDLLTFTHLMRGVRSN